MKRTASYKYDTEKEQWVGIIVEERDNGKKIPAFVKVFETQEELDDWCAVMTHPIDLEAAWSWTCPVCEAMNFESSVVCEMAWEEKQECKIQRGIPLDEDGEFITWPDCVECSECGFTSDSDFEKEGF
jgi:hypothetical protein